MFNTVDKGNSLADKASGANQYLLHFPGFTRHTYSTSQLLKDLLVSGQWYIADTHGVPRLEPVNTAIQDVQHERYLHTRDEYRASDTTKPRPPFWSSASCKMAARQFNLTIKRSYAQQTRITKIIYDHYYHGENRVKGISDTALRIEKNTCHLCSNDDSE